MCTSVFSPRPHPKHFHSWGSLFFVSVAGPCFREHWSPFPRDLLFFVCSFLCCHGEAQTVFFFPVSLDGRLIIFKCGLWPPTTAYIRGPCSSTWAGGPYSDPVAIPVAHSQCRALSFPFFRFWRARVTQRNCRPQQVLLSHLFAFSRVFFSSYFFQSTCHMEGPSILPPQIDHNGIGFPPGPIMDLPPLAKVPSCSNFLSRGLYPVGPRTHFCLQTVGGHLAGYLSSVAGRPPRSPTEIFCPLLFRLCCRPSHG